MALPDFLTGLEMELRLRAVSFDLGDLSGRGHREVGNVMGSLGGGGWRRQGAS
jgi:hypothetical protein